MNRQEIADQLAAAMADVETADAELYAADALAEVTSRPGLRYAPIGPDEMSYVVACDGKPIGEMWRGEGGHLLGDWTAKPFGAVERLGPFPTARAAVAGLASACGEEPRHIIT